MSSPSLADGYTLAGVGKVKVTRLYYKMDWNWLIMRRIGLGVMWECQGLLTKLQIYTNSCFMFLNHVCITRGVYLKWIVDTEQPPLLSTSIQK